MRFSSEQNSWIEFSFKKLLRFVSDNVRLKHEILREITQKKITCKSFHIWWHSSILVSSRSPSNNKSSNKFKSLFESLISGSFFVADNLVAEFSVSDMSVSSVSSSTADSPSVFSLFFDDSLTSLAADDNFLSSLATSSFLRHFWARCCHANARSMVGKKKYFKTAV